MGNTIIIIIAVLICVESAFLLSPFIFKRKLEDHGQPTVRQESMQDTQIVIDESNIDNFDSKPLIDKHLSEIQQEKNSPVYVIKNDSEEELGYQAIKQLNPKIDANKPFLIKPNVGGFQEAQQGEDNGMVNRTTSPIFVKGIIKYLRENGVKDIAIGEGFCSTSQSGAMWLFEFSGYKKLAEEMGIKLIDLDYYYDGNKNSYPIKIKYPDAKLLKDDIYVSKTYLMYLAKGTIINVPKLKTHRFTITSLSIKNLMGVLIMARSSVFCQSREMMHPGVGNRGQYLTTLTENGARKRAVNEPGAKINNLSYQLFSQRLSDLYVAAKPDFTIIDGYIGTEGNGFNNIKTREEHIAFASENQIYADQVANSYMGFVNSSYLKSTYGFYNPLYLEEAFGRFYKGINGTKNIKIINPENIKFNKKPYWHTTRPY